MSERMWRALVTCARNRQPLSLHTEPTGDSGDSRCTFYRF